MSYGLGGGYKSQESSIMTSQTKYVAYIDEAGDDGLKNVANADGYFGSDWFVLSCVVARYNYTLRFPDLLEEARSSAGMPSGRDIHFVKLNNHKRNKICGILAASQIRWFAAISHKNNMRSYHNKRAQSVSKKRNTLYNWLTRLILERVTRYCHDDLIKLKQPVYPQALKVIMSSRGGLTHGDIGSYISKLWIQSRSSSLYLNKGYVDFDIFAPSGLSIKNNFDVAGLQLADIVASSIYKSLPQKIQSNPCSAFIDELLPRCAERNGMREEFGITFWPQNWRHTLSPENPML